MFLMNKQIILDLLPLKSLQLTLIQTTFNGKILLLKIEDFQMLVLEAHKNMLNHRHLNLNQLQIIRDLVHHSLNQNKLKKQIHKKISLPRGHHLRKDML